jgi:hypothetical protein
MWEVGVKYHLRPLVQCALHCADVEETRIKSATFNGHMYRKFGRS